MLLQGKQFISSNLEVENNLPRVIISEKLSKPLGGNDEKTVDRLIGNSESFLPCQHHIDHAQVMIGVLMADINGLQTAQHLEEGFCA